ncbi:exodeoxyribonuclease V subunit gamma [Pseudoxanthomonas koreensis]|uniref:exodeoxyribonuclease V subunit gamma n=1 Tax=Pseudoxanthomonas koreensis TaxID=266061 RepID=UPI001391CD03|nr:exodeoxyribonuclease V subunit gamma [Pseudoxanthomonas koreensis]KAF1694157.1 exodeoxyribonuclease V subunit gamma [Pseudoxanthomonas koreensis]
MTAAPDFRLYHSNALDVLAGILAEVLREPAPGQPLLAPEVVLIPQVAMRRWLQATLAAAHGVAANIEFLTPGEFVGRALAANPGPEQATDAIVRDATRDELDAAMLHWHLYAALTDPAVLAMPGMAAIAAHVGGGGEAAGQAPLYGEHVARSGGGDPLRAWALAGELAGVFEKYQAWRRDWLLRWEAGADRDDPQAILWRRVASGRAHRARRIQQYLERFGAHDGPLPRGLPPRLSAFATLNVSPDVLRVIATQARVGSLHLFVPSPVADYWGDLQRQRRGEAAEDAGEHPLLQRWGAAGVDFMRMVGDYEVVHASAELQANVDPGAVPALEAAGAGAGGPPEAGAGNAGSGAAPGLLRRLQSDLFHRRAAPGFPPRDEVDRGDPSLQLHACHTRLRELQVLHDQLRGLFDDPRFDPPLQPREVAVLAPDIDPYLPYLDAVFGRRGQDDAIPYALADASPLANEPLAEVFLRLLALPVSRFGLHEVLDLLSSPALAEANGLDAPALERLQSWLEQAGARWGIDARHRAGFDAPEDEAYTWAFALDRLLLGHATGSDAPVLLPGGQVLAPLPELEGGALDALDTLVRLLRVLALHARVLGEAMPPAHWRDRLLHLLDALLPRAPSNPATQRALDRLRSLVDAFAATAARAGYEAPVPAEAVRAHFADALAEADPRAPLLTGGVSVGRMVPMRLLPFRVVCVLGMNDGEFPRRDPAAGLNRLTAALGSDRRRPGDRSTRDDDRFLFLQLMVAAQDVFYVSWIGNDPRDGSERESSVLVSELVDVAKAHHADPEAAARELVVRHPLQPFSPAAFGASGESRRFSYREAWRDAAAQPATRRIALPPWFAGEALPAITDESAPALQVDELQRFLRHPARALVRRMGLQLPEVEAAGEDIEPLSAPGTGLEKMHLQQAVFEALLRDEDSAATHALLRARGLLPSGASGRRVLAVLRGGLAPYAEAFRGWRGDAQPQSLVLPGLEIDGVRLQGRIGNAWPHGLARLRFGEPNGPSSIRHGLDWLLASAAGLALPLVEFHETKEGPGPHIREPLPPAQARQALGRLLQLRAQGLREPLPFAPYSSWELYCCSDNFTRAVKQASAKWHGNGRGFAEGEDPALRLALRGRDPFADDAMLLRFADTTMVVFAAVVEGRVYEGVDAEALRGLADAWDAEDAA